MLDLDRVFANAGAYEAEEPVKAFVRLKKLYYFLHITKNNSLDLKRIKMAFFHLKARRLYDN